MFSRVATSTFIALLLMRTVAAESAGDDYQSFIYFSDRGPFVIRLHVRIDGMSGLEARQAYGDDLFTSLDRNSDGILDSQEAKGIPSVSQLRGENENPSRMTQPKLGADTRPTDGKVSKKELLAYLMQYGTPFAFDVTPQSSTQPIDPFPSQQQADTMVFDKLDRDQNGRLSRDEIVMDSQLRKLDLDDDETLSQAELQPVSNPYAVRSRLRRSSSTESPSAPFVHIGNRGTLSSRLVRELLERYDKEYPGNEQDKRLSQTELGATVESFSSYDADGNGQLDFEELSRFVRDPQPHVSVTMRLGKRDKDQPAVQFSTPSEELPLGAQIRSHGQSGTLVIDNVQLNFSVSDGGANASAAQDMYLQQFNAIDADNNGYLEMKEVERIRTFQRDFDQMDHDGDDKIFEKEFVAYFKRLAVVARSRTVLSVADQGNGLFDILDSNRDGRLTSREISVGQNKILDWDENKDNETAKTEIPRRWQLTLGRGSPSMGGVRVTVVSARPNRPAPRRTGGPSWFQRMDRNDDGEVTQREFLGQSAHFQRIDSNEDGAIDAAEASQID